MSVISDQKLGPSSGSVNTGGLQFILTVPSELYSLLDAVDSKSIANQFEIGRYSPIHDLDDHLKVAVREGFDPSNYFAELADKTRPMNNFKR